MVDFDSRHNPQGRLGHGPEMTLAERTIEFIRSQLPEWRDDPDRPDEEGEDLLNVQLCDYLDCSARLGFPMVRFSREEPQVGKRKVDLAAKPAMSAMIHGRVYTKYEPFLAIEGKRLPAPKTDREREYVTGGQKTTGGIQRFKLGAHGSYHTKAVLVGYIQREDGTYWWRTINGWIADLVTGDTADGCEWDDSDRLQRLNVDPATGIASCSSNHRRSGDAVTRHIALDHLWVAMNRGNDAR
jgi:hypothetical protein